ncbi:MAG: hypothetical protein A2Y40_02805 [Candidatus Margulisbacteria bacterium GWF2_35_9]|nr:MAG: hypothetical protein A2Y40_02805 [Candidatus Margulisbacteria bacterium GWF2_35_9]
MNETFLENDKTAQQTKFSGVFFGGNVPKSKLAKILTNIEENSAIDFVKTTGNDKIGAKLQLLLPEPLGKSYIEDTVSLPFAEKGIIIDSITLDADNESAIPGTMLYLMTIDISGLK